jgi:hypothetical protein
MQLKVQKLPDGDGWRDMVRIPHKFRKDDAGEHIARGHVVRIRANGKCGYVVVRGYDYKPNEPHDGLIFVDSTWRGKLKLDPDKTYEITIEPAGRLADWLWIWRANDPLIRIPAQISLISFFLGILALLLAIPPSVDWIETQLRHQSSGSSAAPSPAGQARESTKPDRR